MQYHLWHSASESSYTLLLEGNRAATLLIPSDASVVTSITAHSYQDALRMQAKLLGIDMHRSARARLREQTERLTVGVYVDQDATNRAVEVGAWVGAFRGEWEPPALTRVLGQVYVERPSPNVATGYRHVTVVHLRSHDGARTMHQEFLGQIDAPRRLTELLEQRLGNHNMTKWQPVASRVAHRWLWRDGMHLCWTDAANRSVKRCRTFEDAVSILSAWEACPAPQAASIGAHALVLFIECLASATPTLTAADALCKLRLARTALDMVRHDTGELTHATGLVLDAAEAAYDDNNFSPVDHPDVEDLRLAVAGAAARVLTSHSTVDQVAETFSEYQPLLWNPTRWR